MPVQRHGIPEIHTRQDRKDVGLDSGNGDFQAVDGNREHKREPPKPDHAHQNGDEKIYAHEAQHPRLGKHSMPARHHQGHEDKQGDLDGGRNRNQREDRKSTRLNSSHGYISYAVFCLKKKKKKQSKSATENTKDTPPPTVQVIHPDYS